MKVEFLLQRVSKTLQEKICSKFSLSDIDAVFKVTSEIEDENNRVDFFFSQFEGLDNDSIIKLWDCYLDEAMQTAYSSGIDSTIGFSRWHGYDTELVDLY